MPSDQMRGAAIRSASSLLIMAPRRSSVAATKRSSEKASRGRGATSKFHADAGVDLFDPARPATAPTDSLQLGPKGFRSRRPSYAEVPREANRLPPLAQTQRMAGAKDVEAMTSVAYLARGTDYICSNFVAPESKPTGRGLVRSNSLPTMHKHKASGKLGAQARDEETIQSLVDALNLPKEAMRAACDVFKRHAEVSPGKSFVQDGRLTRVQFAAVLRDLTGRKNHTDLPYELLSAEFQRAGEDSQEAIDFGEFALWFSSRNFNEHLNLDAGQRALRRLARENNMPYPDVDKYKKSFNEFDIDRDGVISKEDFQHVLYKLSKVPENVGLPQERVQYLWSGADADLSGELDFEEFLVFYKKYFDTKSGGGSGFEDYYRSIRRCSMAK